MATSMVATKVGHSEPPLIARKATDASLVTFLTKPGAR